MFNREWVEALARRHGWERAGVYEREFKVVFVRKLERRWKTFNIVGEHSVDPGLLDCYQREGGCKKAYPRCMNEVEATEGLWDLIRSSEEEDFSLVFPLELPAMIPLDDLLNCLVPVHTAVGNTCGGRWSTRTCRCGTRGIKYEEVVPAGTPTWGPRLGPGADGPGYWDYWDDSDGLVTGTTPRDGVCGAEELKQTFTVWWTTGTTRSDLKHPKTGKKRPLYRRLDLKNFSDPKAELGQLFANPRKHTGVGYYTKVRQLCGDVQC